MRDEAPEQYGRRGDGRAVLLNAAGQPSQRRGNKPVVAKPPRPSQGGSGTLPPPPKEK